MIAAVNPAGCAAEQLLKHRSAPTVHLRNGTAAGENSPRISRRRKHPAVRLLCRPGDSGQPSRDTGIAGAIPPHTLPPREGEGIT